MSADVVCSVAASNRTRILYLFAGPPREWDAPQLCEFMGCTIRALDLERSEAHDLADDTRWDSVVHDLKNRKFDAVLMSPPCSTFSAARSAPGGPPPLRAPDGEHLYGLPRLSPSQQEQVKMGTLLALRGAEAARLCNELGLPWIAETPRMRVNHPSVFKLGEWKAVRAAPKVEDAILDQCQFRSVVPRSPD